MRATRWSAQPNERIPLLLLRDKRSLSAAVTAALTIIFLFRLRVKQTAEYKGFNRISRSIFHDRLYSESIMYSLTIIVPGFLAAFASAQSLSSLPQCAVSFSRATCFVL